MSVQIELSVITRSLGALVFQACKAGRVQHLEQLIYYGADMNRQNCSGNTPLHVCAINNQVWCLRALQFDCSFCCWVRCPGGVVWTPGDVRSFVATFHGRWPQQPFTLLFRFFIGAFTIDPIVIQCHIWPDASMTQWWSCLMISTRS